MSDPKSSHMQQWGEVLSQQVEKEKEEGNQQERPGLKQFALEFVNILRNLES